MPNVRTPSANTSEKHSLTQASATAEMNLLAQYGIKEVPLTSFKWGGFRYTQARDAIVAARRESAK